MPHVRAEPDPEIDHSLTSENLPDYLPTAYITKKFAITQESIKRYINTGCLPAQKKGKAWYVAKDDFLLFLTLYRTKRHPLYHIKNTPSFYPQKDPVVERLKFLEWGKTSPLMVYIPQIDGIKRHHARKKEQTKTLLANPTMTTFDTADSQWYLTDTNPTAEYRKWAKEHSPYTTPPPSDLREIEEKAFSQGALTNEQ